MKKTALIIALLVSFMSFVSCQGFARGRSDESYAKKTDITRLDGEITRLNGEITRLDGEVTKPGAGSGNSGSQTGGGAGGNSQNRGPLPRIPVNQRIVKFLLEDDGNSSGLKFYISEAIVVKIFEAKETAEIEKKDNMIVLNNPQLPDTPKKTTEFSKDSEGVINGFGPESDRGRQIKIRFPDQENRTLIFTRNLQKDNYELTEVEVLDDKIRRIDSLFAIELMVAGSNDRKTELKVMPAEYAYINNQQQDNKNILNNNYSYTYYDANTPQPNVNYNRSVNTFRSVMGQGSLNPQSVINYVRKEKNPSLSNSDIAVIYKYFEEAGKELVNVDIAIAQMLHWTDNFKRRDRIATCNYGGLSRIDGFNGTFPYRMQDGMTEGVRAHIQHLMGYAKQTPRQQPIVDPRYRFAIERGSPGITFDQVYRWWSQSPDYGQKIDNILRDLYRY